MQTTGETAKRRWCVAPAAVVVRRAQMRAALPWDVVRERLCAAVGAAEPVALGQQRAPQAGADRACAPPYDPTTLS